MKEVKPLEDRVLIKTIDAETKTKSGIVLPETAQDKPQIGIVKGVGPGRMTDEGIRVPIGVEVGDRVLYAKYGGTDVKVDGESVLVVRNSDILAIIVET